LLAANITFNMPSVNTQDEKKLQQGINMKTFNKIIISLALFLYMNAIYAQSILTEFNIEFCRGDNLPLLMDIAYPDNISNRPPVPAVILIHGGSWRGGLRAGMFDKASELATNGYFAATIDYRLTHLIERDGADPMKAGVDYRKMIQDVKCAVRHLKTEANKYNIDSLRIATFGTSAGGHLAATMGVNRTPWHDQNRQYQDVDSSVAAVVSWFGPQDLQYNYDNVPFSQFFIAELLDGTPLEFPDRYYNTSPINFLSPNDPPMITIHGTDDETVPVEVAIAFDEACAAQGIRHVLEIIEGGTHGFPMNSAIAMDKTIRFLDSVFR